MFIPFVVAFGAKSIPALYIFVDYCFSFLILGEILSILICIQRLKTRNKDIKEVDIYNLMIKKFQDFLAKHLKIKEVEERGEKYEDRKSNIKGE